MQKHTISLCMIVKNEEKYLERCLSSVQGKVDEIIVVDTGSTDKTIEIANKYNAIVKHFDWIDDFAAARNYSIKDVESQYIFVLDADEYLDDNADLQSTLAQGKDYYMLLMKSYQDDGKSVMHQNIRLFRAGIGLRYKGKLHEHLNINEEDSNFTYANSDILIHHVGYLLEVVQGKDKKKRNYDIMVKEVNENPTGYSYFNMGVSYMNNQKFDKALEMFQKSFPLSKSRTYLKGMLVRMGECLSILNRAEEGIMVLSDAINAFPDYTDLYFTLGILYRDIGYLLDAELKFKECLRLGEKIERVSNEGVGSYLANYHLAVTYEKKGRYGEAFDEAFRSVMINKSYYPALAIYLKLMQRSGIAIEEQQKQLEIIYPIGSTIELNNLISALYMIRHKLISKYDLVFGDEKNIYLRAVAHMLNGNYKKSLEEWKRVDNIPSDNLTDVLVISLISNDMFLLEKIKAELNLSAKEWKYFTSVMGKEEILKSYNTPDIEKLFLDIAFYLLDIEDYEQFEYISKFILDCSVETQNKLAERLIALGHVDTALELLSLNHERYPENHEVHLLAGDIFSTKEDFITALEFYKKSMKLKDYYPAYERTYETYKKMGLKKEQNELIKAIKVKFPLSIWAKMEVSV